MKRFVLVPGFVRSINDGDEHYITANMLARLYGVSIAECIVDNGRPLDLYGRNTQDLPRLHPRRDGRYEMPKEKTACP